MKTKSLFVISQLNFIMSMIDKFTPKNLLISIKTKQDTHKKSKKREKYCFLIVAIKTL